MRGRCPRPIDERAVTAPPPSKCVGQELNLQCPKAGGLRPPGHAHAQPTQSSSNRQHVTRVGVEPTNDSPRFELGRFSNLRTVPSSQASSMGFEPTISCVTGRRALRAAPRGQKHSVAQVGVEPTASLVLSQGGLPIAYRAATYSLSKCPERESNSQSLGFKPSRSANWRTWAQLINGPEGNRTLVAWV